MIINKKIIFVRDLLLQNKEIPIYIKKEFLFCLLKKDNFREIKNKFLNKELLRKYKKMTFLYQEKKIPFAYLTKRIFFFNLKKQLLITKKVFIPRFETEFLVEKIIYYLNKNFVKNNDLTILDIGTGSGNIAIVLEKNLSFRIKKIIATDISSSAIKLALLNVKEHDCKKIYFLKTKIFNDLNCNFKFNLIVSNPPYVATDFKINEYVKKEPKKALFAGKYGLDFYKTFFKKTHLYLANDFLIALEIGFDQKNSLKKLLLKNSFFKNCNVVFEKDLQNKWRYLFIWKKICYKK